MRSAAGGLTATLYGASTVRTTVGHDHTPVVITQTTDYPFTDTITFKFASEHKAKFPLSLRVPAWCRNPQLRMNGKDVALTPEKGFVTLERRFQPGDTLTFTLPMTVARTAWPYQGVALERGPLVYALPIKEESATFTVPEFSDTAYPGYNANPTSPWNYALALKPGDLADQVKVQQPASGGTPGDNLPSATASDPWAMPPITLTVAARKIESYRLQGVTTEKDQFFTPPLPDLAFTDVSPETEQITLVPYGCTQLRVTVFSDLDAAGKA